MLAVLTSTLVAVVGIGDALKNRHYDLVAQEMVDSGVAHVVACDNSLDGNWPVGAYSLKPNTNCMGVVQSGVPEYITSDSNVHAAYSVDVEVTVSSGITTISIKSRGIVDLIRTSTNVTWRSYTRDAQSFYQPTAITDVAQARTHSCILSGDKNVYCVGDNSAGQLGIGTNESLSRPTEKFLLPDGLSAVEVVADEKQTCVRASDRQLYCAGDNTYGQLGDGTTTNRSTPVRFNSPTNRKVASVQIARDLFGPGDLDSDTSRPYTCALTTSADGSSGQVYCAGSNQYGQLGDGTTTNQSTPVKFTLPSGTVQSFAVGPSDGATSADGHSHTCVIANTNIMYCAGRNLEGQLGDGSYTNRSTPVRFGTLSDIQSVKIAYRDTCVIRQGGSLMCAGENRVGRFGNGNSGASYNQPTAAFTSGVSGTITQVEMGPNQTCVLSSTHRAYCSGYGAYGRLGNNSSSSTSTPVQYVTAGAATNLDSIGIGDIQTCVLTSTTKAAYCAGYNRDGRLGIGSFASGQGTSNPYPTEGKFILPSGVTVAKVIAGTSSTCILTTIGKGYCAGANTYGQLGNDILEDQSTPVRALLIDPGPLYY
jgi:alpha-tubulin suppressor-like RCC1 family protein